jgi:two-component sensor histidine kinase
MILQEIRSRMSIMRLVQDNIRKSELLGSLNLRAHLTSLANTMYQEGGLTGKAEFQLELGNIGDVEINDLVPLSLLVSELLRVSIGHAQDGQHPCAVTMTLGRLDSHQLELRYDDHTSSINPKTLETGTTTGALVHAWATVLGGSIRLLKGETTTFQFTFKAAPAMTLQRAS